MGGIGLAARVRGSGIEQSPSNSVVQAEFRSRRGRTGVQTIVLMLTSMTPMWLASMLVSRINLQLGMVTSLRRWMLTH